MNLRRAGTACFAGFTNAACGIFYHPPHYTTRLSGYGLDASCIPAIVQHLEEHGRFGLGEHEDIDPQVAGKVLQECV